MDSEDEHGGLEEQPRPLPADLPTSLDDRRPATHREEAEMWDGWQGQSHTITTGEKSTISYDLGLGTSGFDRQNDQDDDDTRLVQMLASQARLREDNSSIADEDGIINNGALSDAEKKDSLQTAFTMAASNGDVDRVKQLVTGKAKDLIDVNHPDSEGTPPLIYASCFGHQDVVLALLESGADVNLQDRNQWSSLMWALTNKHKNIAKILLDKGANPDVKSSTGRTAFDFVAPCSEVSDYLHASGYNIGSAGMGEDFYDTGFSQERFEEEMAENEMKRRMMMESAINLEVDLGNLGLDEQPESPQDYDDEPEFIWDKCLNDQMFVFQENDLDRILDVIITNMTPQRSPSQKPVPANILFLSARYAHYHASADLLEKLLGLAMNKINWVVERYQWDMTILAFWISNATLLLHYLKKDSGLVEATSQFQAHLAELINEIFILILRDAERRMDKSLDAAIMDHETIPGFEDVHFQNEWKIFRTKPKPKPLEPIGKRYRPPSPKKRMQPSPRNITSLLSSTLFVLELYDIHTVITSQILSQLFYWLGAEIFNRIMSNRKYLSRTKAMQIRMNVSTLEDWARSNNRNPDHYENGSTTSSGENTVDACRRHLGPVVQLLQWLQCFSSLGEDLGALDGTLQQLPRLSMQQILHSVKYYRAEVGEKSLPKSAMKHLLNLQKEASDRKAKGRSQPQTPQHPPATPVKSGDVNTPMSPDSPSAFRAPEEDHQQEDAPEHLLLDTAFMLPFQLPSSTDMLVSYGAGFGGLNRERERKYIPTVPPEFLSKLDPSGGKGGKTVYEGQGWEEEGS